MINIILLGPIQGLDRVSGKTETQKADLMGGAVVAPLRNRSRSRKRN